MANIWLIYRLKPPDTFPRLPGARATPCPRNGRRCHTFSKCHTTCDVPHLAQLAKLPSFPLGLQPASLVSHSLCYTNRNLQRSFYRFFQDGRAAKRRQQIPRCALACSNIGNRSEFSPSFSRRSIASPCRAHGSLCRSCASSRRAALFKRFRAVSIKIIALPSK